jgi:hypothetical protein
MMLALKPNAKDLTHIKVEVRHQKERNNWFHGVQEQRGIKAHATPGKLDPEWNTFSFMLGTAGAKITLEPMERLNRKKVAAWEVEADRQIKAKEGKVWELIQHVLHAEGVELQEEAQAA